VFSDVASTGPAMWFAAYPCRPYASTARPLGDRAGRWMPEGRIILEDQDDQDDNQERRSDADVHGSPSVVGWGAGLHEVVEHAADRADTESVDDNESGAGVGKRLIGPDLDTGGEFRRQ
jgi:hypothetical protein